MMVHSCYFLYPKRKSDFLNKKKSNWYVFALFSLIIGILLMKYLRQVYFVGIIVLFIVVAFQTPTTHVDKTGEANDFNNALIKIVGASTIGYLIGGYTALLLF